MSYVKISIIKLKRWLKYIVGSFLKVIDKLNLVLFSVLQRFQVFNFVKKKKDKNQSLYLVFSLKSDAQTNHWESL